MRAKSPLYSSFGSNTMPLYPLTDEGPSLLKPPADVYDGLSVSPKDSCFVFR